MAVDSSIIAAILSTSTSGAALIAVLLITGILSTKPLVDRITRDAADWKAAFEAEKNARETERAANDELRAAAVVQSQRADAAVETAKLATAFLEDLRKRTHEAP